MINEMPFADFLKHLSDTNFNLSSFNDFDKCNKYVSKISMKLYALNHLLGKEDLEYAIKELFDENPKCFEVLKILIAVRDNKNILDNDGKLKKMILILSLMMKFIDFLKKRA